MSKIIIAVLLLITCNSAVSAETPIKDGRTYMLELTRRLTESHDQAARADLMKSFRELRQNLPKQTSFTSLSASIDGMTKIAVRACSFASYWEDNFTDLKGLYRKMLDREPTAQEVKSALRNDSGELDFFANCLALALHPEFILQKQ